MEQVLSWISYALQPLSIGALQHAVAIYPRMAALVPEAVKNKTFLISVCAGLVVINNSDVDVDSKDFDKRSPYRSPPKTGMRLW